MQNALLKKLAVVGLIILLLLIPLQLISAKITERNAFSEYAKNSVAESWTASQTIVGPILVIPYEVEVMTETRNSSSDKSTYRAGKVLKKRFIHPEQLHIDVVLKNETRAKGIYKFPVYTAAVEISGFVNSAHIRQVLDSISAEAAPGGTGTPYLAAAITDPRGINSAPNLDWLGEKLPFLPGSKLDSNPHGIHALLPGLGTTVSGTNSSFRFQLELRGMEALLFVPPGQQVSVTVSSSWPHPAFSGRHLPIARSISDAGYEARWKINSFASNVSEKVAQCEQDDCRPLLSSAFGVKHIEPVDVYLQSERSVKYGILFIGLSFVAFFIFEILNKLPIHAIQYTLVGFAVAIFYLLLFSLAEHIRFAFAYAAAAICCVSLLFFYLRYVLGGIKQAAVFSGALLTLYALLFVIISAEDFALLMGAVLTFSTLAVIMISTRKIDWYRAGRTEVP